MIPLLVWLTIINHVLLKSIQYSYYDYLTGYNHTNTCNILEVPSFIEILLAVLKAQPASPGDNLISFSKSGHILKSLRFLLSYKVDPELLTCGI